MKDLSFLDDFYKADGVKYLKAVKYLKTKNGFKKKDRFITILKEYKKRGFHWNGAKFCLEKGNIKIYITI
ncbi:MAG: hypothetical protein ACYDDE_00770 [bacterium]